MGFPRGSAGKESTCNAGDLGWEDPLEKGKATHYSILAWRILDTTEQLSLSLSFSASIIAGANSL